MWELGVHIPHLPAPATRSSRQQVPARQRTGATLPGVPPPSPACLATVPAAVNMFMLATQLGLSPCPSIDVGRQALAMCRGIATLLAETPSCRRRPRPHSHLHPLEEGLLLPTRLQSAVAIMSLIVSLCMLRCGAHLCASFPQLSRVLYSVDTMGGTVAVMRT